jgi:hypothetical protein
MALAVVAGSAFAAVAAPISLFDRNSRADFDNPGGQVNWVVDGVTQLFEQRFFYRTGAMTSEVAVDTLPALGPFGTDTNAFADPRPDVATYQFNDNAAGLEFEFSFKLRGGLAGTGNSDLAETLVIRNLGSTTQTVSFFQYVDFDLGGTSSGDVVRIDDGRVAVQSEVNGGFFLTETVVAPAPFAFQAGLFPTIAGSLNDNAITNLDNSTGPFVGDATWAFQWNFTLAPNTQFTISKDKLIVPTPGALALLGLGGLVATRRRR